jgi:hypothetical protein
MELVYVKTYRQDYTSAIRVKDRAEATALAMVVFGFEGVTRVEIIVDGDVALTLPMEYKQ